MLTITTYQQREFNKERDQANDDNSSNQHIALNFLME